MTILPILLQGVGRRLRHAVVALALVLAACSGVINPVTGERQYTLLSPADEVRLGAAEHPRVVAQFGGAYNEPELAGYVDRLGQRLAAASEATGSRFTFTVLDTPDVNAFALPGGYVYVTRGLLALANDEAELAGVLAHEIGHISARHAAERYDAQVYGAINPELAGVLAGVLLGRNDVDRPVGDENLRGRPDRAKAEAYVQSFSRQQEFEADLLGIRYLERTGYDSVAMATFLQSLQRQDLLEKSRQDRLGKAGRSMSTSHPRTMERVQRALAAADIANPSDVRNPEPLLNAVDGLVFGDDPAQGVERDGYFIHPELRFRFQVPAGLVIENTPRAVFGQTPTRLFMQFDATALPTDIGIAQATQRAVSPRLVLGDVQAEEINGQRAAVAADRVAFDNRPADVVAALIEREPGAAYRFLFLKPGALSPPERQLIRSIIASFEGIDAAEAAKFPPRRIQVIPVESGDTVASLANRMAVETQAEAQFRVLNGLEPSDRVKPGQRVKIVVEGGAAGAAPGSEPLG